MDSTTHILVGEVTIGAYSSDPAGDAPYPAVVVLHEWVGLDDHVRDVADRLAAEGYVALVPDLYEGQVASDDAEAERLMETYFNAAPPKAMAAYDALTARDDVGKVGCIGLSMGGMLALDLATKQPALSAAVVLYGLPEAYLGQIESVRSPLLGLYGERDPWVPLEPVNQLDKALDEAGLAHEVVIYPGADHDFLNDRGATYQPEAAQDAWRRTLAFFGEHLR